MGMLHVNLPKYSPSGPQPDTLLGLVISHEGDEEHNLFKKSKKGIMRNINLLTFLSLGCKEGWHFNTCEKNKVCIILAKNLINLPRIFTVPVTKRILSDNWKEVSICTGNRWKVWSVCFAQETSKKYMKFWQIEDVVLTILRSGPRLHSTLWYCAQALSRHDWEQYWTSQHCLQLQRKQQHHYEFEF